MYSIGPMVSMVCTAGVRVNAVDFQVRTALHELALDGVNAVKPYLDDNSD
jgi:hypothetical protein